jgi:hypothetical protein
MKVATYEGFIENGKVRLPDNIRLPERAKVYVIVPDVEVESLAYIRSPRLVHPEQAEDFKKEVIQGITDAGI